MTSRSILIALIILFASPNLSFSQGTLSARTTFDFLLNGVDTDGVIHKSDSIVSVVCSDNGQYSILGIEMACADSILKCAGNQFSKQMIDCLRSNINGQRVHILITLRSPNSTLMKVVAVFTME